MSATGKIKKVNGFTFTWHIEDFTLWILHEKQTIVSPMFRIEQVQDMDLRLTLYLPGDDEEDIILNLHRYEKDEVGPSSVDVNGKLFIEKTDGSYVFLGKICKFFQIDSAYAKPLSISRKTVSEANFLHKDILTVGFQFFINNDFPIERIGRSKLSLRKYSVSLPLKFPDGDEEELTTTPLFSVIPDHSRFRIYLFSRNFTEAAYPITVQIPMSNFPFKAFVQYNLSFLCNEDLKFEKKIKHVVDPRKGYGMSVRVTRATFFEHSIFDANSMKCELMVSIGYYTSYMEKIIYNQNVQDSPTSYSLDWRHLQSNLKQLYSEKDLCDFEIIVSDKEFSVHKIVLAAVSPVFRAMFESGMIESESSRMKIEEFSAETVEKMLEFSYSGNVKDLMWDMTLELYSIADKYQIQNLKTLCTSFLESALRVETVPDLLILADLHGDMFLSKVVENFICGNSKAVFQSEVWKLFMKKNVQVACATMYRICQSVLQ